MTTTQPSRPSGTQPDARRTREREPAQRHTPASGGTAPWLLVAAREIHVRITNRTFLISTAVTLLLIAGISVFQSVMSNRTTTHVVAVTSSDARAIVDAAGRLAKEADDKVTVRPQDLPDDAAARRALDEGQSQAWLQRDGDGWVLTSTDEVDRGLAAAVGEAARARALSANAAAAGTTVDALERGSEVTTTRIDGRAPDSGPVNTATFAFALLFYLAAMVFGLQIAGSVVEEKQSRLVEIIASAIPLRHLLAGKIVANSALALAQVVLYCMVGLIALSFTDLSLLLPGLNAAVGWFVAFFAVGFLALACLYAVAGALASRNEDLQQTTAPMTIVLMLVYFASFGLSGTWERVASFLPIASVVAMPARILSGEAQWWEPVLALVVMAGFAFVTLFVGERVYRRALLQTGGRVSWRGALRPET